MNRLATIAAALTLAAVAMAAVPVVGELQSTYKEYIKKGQLAHDPAEIRVWIHRFETEVARSNPKVEGFYDALAVLGDLYNKVGDRAGSLRVREGILHAAGAPAIVRLQAGMAAIFVKDRDGKDPGGLLALSGEVERLLEAGGLGASRNAFQDEAVILQFKTVQWTIALGKERSTTLIAEGHKPLADEALRLSLTQADAGLARYLGAWAGRPADVQGRLLALNYGTDAAMYLRGDVEFSLANADLASGRKADAEREFAAAANQLTELLRLSPKNPLYSQPAAVLLLRIKERDGGDSPEYLEYVKTLLPQIAGGHTVINHLSDMSMSYSSGKTRLAASRLFDVVIGQERAWFPNEYQGHINYQVALLESTVNYVGMDDLKAAGQRLRVLKTTRIIDPHLQVRLSDVSEIYGAKFATSLPPASALGRYALLFANLALVACVLLVLVVKFLLARKLKAV